MPCNQKNIGFWGVLASTLILCACNSLFKKDKEENAIARVGDVYLYKKDVAGLVTKDMSPQDSAALINSYIQNWATKQLFMDRSKINLPENQLAEYNRLVEEYRADLYTRAYIEALVQKEMDTTVTNAQFEKFYEEQKDNFKLDEKLVQLRFVVLNTQFLNKDEVEKRLKNFDSEDKQFLDSIGVQFKKAHFNDSIWVSTTRLISEIAPLDSENQDKHLKNSQFFELEDSLAVYLGKVNKVLMVNDIAPLSYIKPNIKQIILNRRRLSLKKKLETEILDQAVKNKDFQTYEPEE